MGKKVTYERWINLFLPDAWTEREEMGFILLEKEGWPGMVQLSFIERDNSRLPPVEAAKILLKTRWKNVTSYSREAVKVEEHGDTSREPGLYLQGRMSQPTEGLVPCDKTRALMAAYQHFGVRCPVSDEVAGIIADIEFIPSTSD
jgi:hypothetical protein